jgi:integrase
VTFDAATNAYLRQFESSWRSPVHKRQWAQSLADYARPVIGQLGVHQITPDDVLRCIGPIWQALPRTADRVRSRIERVLNYAGRHPDNPAAWRGLLEFRLTPRPSGAARNFPALEWTEMPKFMAELRAVDGMQARALEVAILTGGRTSEVRQAPWTEFDLSAGLWVIPKGRYKTKQEHVVPLSAAAVAILRGLPRAGERVFPTVADRAMWRLTKKLDPDISVHGFRATFKSWCSIQDYPRETTELCLGHKIGSAVEQAYQRERLIDKRRAVFDAWARFCAGKEEADTLLRRLHRDGGDE